MIYLIFWLIILHARPPVGVAVIYGVWLFLWWLSDQIGEKPAGSGVPLNVNGRTTYMKIGGQND